MMPIEAYLYRVSLESPGRWAMCTSTGLETSLPYLNIGTLSAFIDGYLAASGNRPAPFFLWLRDTVGAFPSEGWAKHHLTLADGDHQRAISLFFERLHEWALETRPDWFTEFNRLPRGSLMMNGLGEHLAADVRVQEHVRAVAGTPIEDLSHLHVSAIELGDGFNLSLGLPRDVGTAWTPNGRRVVMLATRRPVNELTEALDSLELPNDAVAADVTKSHADVVTTSDAGLVHVRDGQLLATVHGRRRLALLPGDRLLLLSPALSEFAKSLEPGALPARLATAEPIAWTQAIDTPRRRLCVAIELRGREHVAALPR